MPKSGRLGVLKLAAQWFKEWSDPKVASDIIQLALKGLPALGYIILPLVVAVVIWFKDSLIKIYKDSPTLFWIILAITVTIIVIYVITMTRDYLLNEKLIKLDIHRDFNIVQHVAVAKILSKTEAVYAFRFIVKAKNGTRTSFPILYNWSGKGNVEIIPRNKRFTVQLQGKVTGNFSKADIIFDRSILKNEEFEIEYHIHTISDHGDVPLPNLGLSAFCKKYPRFNTHLLVSFDATTVPISIYRDYFYGSQSLGAFKTLTGSLDDQHTHTWNVRSIMGWLYCIRWDFGV